MPTYLRILKLIKVMGEAMTVSEIAESLALSTGTVRSVLKIQEQALRVEKSGVAHGGGRCYRLTTIGREAIAAQEVRP